MLRSELISTHFDVVVGGSAASLLVSEPLDKNRGTEGIKYSGVDVRGLGLGFDVGFMTVGDEATISLRQDNWSQMHKDGLGDFLVKHSVPVTLVDDQGQVQHAIISEDLLAEGWEIFEANQVHREIGELGELSLNATRWMAKFLDQLSGDNCLDKPRKITPTLPTQVGTALNWYVDFYHEKYEKLPHMDPVVEYSLDQLLENMRLAGWTARTESLFVLTRESKLKTWPYERKVIIGDVGKGVIKGGCGGLDKKHLDHFYDMLSYFYAPGK